VLVPLGFAVSELSSEAEGDPAVTSNGRDYLASWTLRSGTMIRGSRVSASGVDLDNPDLLVADPPGALGARQSSVASDGSGYLVAWTGPRASGAPQDIIAAQVSTTGVVGSAFPVSQAAGSEDEPDATWDGGRYLVLWRDERNGSFPLGDVFGARVSASGQVLDPNGFAVASGVESESDPAVTEGPGDKSGAVYLRFAAEPPHDGTQRAFLRLISPK
jgi:hypothetical protein